MRPGRWVAGEELNPQMVAVARDLAYVGGAVVAVLGLTATSVLEGVFPHQPAHLALTIAAAAAGASAAILADMVWRLSLDRRFAWLSAAFALYSLAVVPSATIDLITDRGNAALQAARLVAFVTVVVLLVLAVRPPQRLTAGGGWVLAAVGLALTLGAAGGVLLVTDPVALAAVLQPPTAVLVACFVAAAAGLVFVGIREGQEAVWRIALGLILVGAAQLFRAGQTGLEPTALTFSALRLLGVVVVLVALVVLVRQVLSAVRAEQDELLVATTDAFRASEQAAERDHELRNGLAGLAGSIQVLSAATSADEHRRLQAAVDAELSRLSTILQPAGPRPEPGSYAVGEVLDHLVTLRMAAGARIEHESDPGLRVVGSPSVLAQIVTNLLTNCTQHAPEATVRVRGYRHDGLAVVEVADDGPGIPAEVAEEVLRRGVRQPDSPGEGLGLHISRRLAEEVGGTLRVLPVQKGCVVRLQLPVTATPGGRHVGVAAVLSR